MKITIAVGPDGTVANAYGVFKRGDQVDWPKKNAQPLVDTGAAVEGHVELEGVPEEKPADEPDDQGETQTSYARKRGHPLAQVEFASDEAAEEAMGAGLTPDHFEGVTQSGKTGFTAADVRGIVSGLEAEEGS